MSTTVDPKSLRLDFESAGLLLTPAEFDAVEEYDDEYRYELVHGVLVVSPFASDVEAALNEEFAHLMRGYIDELDLKFRGYVTLPGRYILLANSRRRADRVIWTGLNRMPNPQVDVPTIVVDFVTQSRRDWLSDYQEKSAEYLAAGVIEYWVIDRFRRTMTVYKQAASDLLIREQQRYSTPLLPDFELPLAQLLVEADRWATGARGKH